MKEVIRLTVVLTVVCVLAGLSLSYVSDATEEARAYQDRLELLSSLNMVLPEHDNEPDSDAVIIDDVTYYISKKDGKINGIAFATSSDKGYSGAIRVMMGITPEGEIITIKILEQKETPGLGTKITEDWFIDQYKGKSLNNARWAVKKDGGDFEQISGATISPRAVTVAVRTGLEAYEKNKQEILGGGDVVQ
ncbi:MAG: Electron transport complex protein RnfG [Deltaproteobacteria bacterium ADurb.BinA179]|jgi:electron transport complex protein RnfG|nr:RnfABCDGE type electron transport complex subunit G [Deltaproteobacteria bacterium]MDI9544064.1 RnfABCDGE type electron transport complex subunit G [Pseudomonadota bacterium]OPZ27126.1 MAG: Electron transport complex protein RnfG [Deltaproteobacteria bacterium ADurb.BinA179]HOD71346.1 RnfABCDGE type electron transport complex subunit G [Deltaproteobacteria bacterium]HOE73234.1 RnfABCDGE type electron transport complex subunit G [Deltaproteobacteria bacterium]